MSGRCSKEEMGSVVCSEDVRWSGCVGVEVGGGGWLVVSSGGCWCVVVSGGECVGVRGGECVGASGGEWEWVLVRGRERVCVRVRGRS